MNISGYTKQLADTENKLYYMHLHFYLNVNDSHIFKKKISEMCQFLF